MIDLQSETYALLDHLMARDLTPDEATEVMLVTMVRLIPDVAEREGPFFLMPALRRLAARVEAGG